MRFISKQQARDMLLGYGKALNGEELINYNKGSIEDDTISTAYESYGCVVFKYEYQDRDEWSIHAVDERSDIISALKNNIAFHGNAPIDGFVLGDFPVEIDKKKHYGWLRFSRIGEYYTDDSIIRITEDNRRLVEEFCRGQNDDSQYANIEIKNFSDTHYQVSGGEYTVLGLFDKSELAGLVSLRNYNEIDMVHLSDIIVKKEYRQKGYAKRLIKAACAVCPGKEYWYNAAWHNEASIASAKSASFRYVGAQLYHLERIIGTL